jgi:prevent-host-death family protein
MGSSLTVTEAARNFSDIVNRVFYRGESMELTRGGKVVARLVPVAGPESATGRDVLEAWKVLPHLTPEEADSFANDLARGREALNQVPASKWD